MMQNMFSPEDRDRMREMFRQAQGLQYLDDPDVRNDLKITPQQEKKIQELREQATGLVSAIGEDLRARFQDRTPPPDMTDEQRQAYMQEMANAVAETVRGSLNEFEGMLGEVNTMLTDEQKAMLKQIGPMRAQSDQLTGGLSYLTTSRAREEFAFTYDQAERIKMIVRDVEADAKKLREEVAGPGKEPTPEELRGEKFAPFREGQKEMVKKALGRIMTILTGEQRDKVQKWSETRMGRSGWQGMRGRRGGPAGGQPEGGPEGPRPGAPPEGQPPAPPPGRDR
jgi:truncated hemoglobin YjbI